MKFVATALAAMGLLVGRAPAAELPNMKAAPAPQRAKVCNIGGMTGVLTAGGVCIKIGGYISAGVQAGNLRASSPPGAAQP